MRVKNALLIVIAMLSILLMVNICAANIELVKGEVAEGDFQWDVWNFPGFYHDSTFNLGTETLSTKIIDSNRLSGESPYGLYYETTAEKARFAFPNWGSYKVIGFLGHKYFAGYVEDDYVPVDDQVLYRNSVDKNSLSEEQLQDIIIDDNNLYTLNINEALKLGDNYKLVVKGIEEELDDYILKLELLENGLSVDSRSLIIPKGYGTITSTTYYYRKYYMGLQKNLVILAVHFKEAYNDANRSFAEIDGIWQISKNPFSIENDKQFGKLVVQTVDPTEGKITLCNKRNEITLDKGESIELLPNFFIKTIDNDNLKYYLYTLKDTQLENGNSIVIVPALDNKPLDNRIIWSDQITLDLIIKIIGLLGALTGLFKFVIPHLSTSIEIKAPANNDNQWMGLIEGRYNVTYGKRARIYVLVRLYDESLVVLENVDMKKNGRWSVRYNLTANRIYRIYAIVTSEILQNGAYIKDIPNYYAIHEVGPVTIGNTIELNA